MFKIQRITALQDSTPSRSSAYEFINEQLNGIVRKDCNFGLFISGSWPIVSCPGDYEFQPGKCKLSILCACRHHIAGLRCYFAEESLCSLPSHSSLPFPGQFVQIQYVVALVNGKEELFECRLEASRNGDFKIVSVDCKIHVGLKGLLVCYIFMVHLRPSICCLSLGKINFNQLICVIHVEIKLTC